MPYPALIIGLGGTGCRVATHVKKELMENSDIWPIKEVKILSFDTDNKSAESALVGGKGQIRRSGQTTGAVMLDSGEFFFIGGNVKDLMRQVAKGQHSHLRSWLLAEEYLGPLQLSDKMYNLNEGAGQFRQFGRLAIFKDLATPTNSIVYNTINDALSRIKQGNPALTSMQVFIISSLAGGTGAGMFVDVAHIVRQIASQSNIGLARFMTLRGYLVLPDAFTRDLEHTWLTSMYARAFAAMRENRRFTVSFDYARGYPMYYHEGVKDDLWHGSVKGKLFDLIYYVDGQGTRSTLSSVQIANGVVPSIADAISAAIDAEAGPAFASYVANVEAERVSRINQNRISPKTATYGSVGTYTIVFPIHHIMETWAHDLGLRLLDNLLVPETFDSRSGIPTALKPNANQENLGEDGRQAGVKFLKALTPVVYQYWDENRALKTVQVEPSLLPGELARIAGDYARQSSGIIQSLISRNIDEWNLYFTPSSEDRETQLLVRRLDHILKVRLYDRAGKVGEIKASDQKQPRGNPQTESADLVDEVIRFKNRHLGDEDPKSGQRNGGMYRTALAQITEYHAARFNRCLELTILGILNGSPNQPGTISKGGKIGYLASFLDSLFEALDRANDAIQRVQKSRREQGESRRNAIAAAKTAENTMIANASKRDLLGRGPGKEAFETQHNYLLKEAELMGILQVEATEEAILETISRMLDYVRSAQEAVSRWEDTLARNSDGLYAQLLRGRKQVDSDRNAERDIKVRHVVSDSDYEKDRFLEYVNAVPEGWINRLLGSLNWQITQRMVAGRPKITLEFQVRGDNDAVVVGQDTFTENLALWLRLCRRPFADARRAESVIGYLRQHREYRNPQLLADMLYENGGTLLNFDGGAPLPANFLRAHFKTEEEAGDRNYLRQVIQRLAERSGQSILGGQPGGGNDDAQENRFARFVNSEDRFKFTLVFTQELIELDTITSYKGAGKDAYLGSSDRATLGDRRLLHIFPAEVNAAFYENRVRELNQSVRLFSDTVTLQLEEKERTRLFLMCYVYGLIQRHGLRDEAGNQRNLWRVVILPQTRYNQDQGDENQPIEYWLTNPNQTPSLLDALTTFNYVGIDNFAFKGTDNNGKRIQRGDNFTQTINYEMIGKALARARELDARSRLENGSAGSGSPDLVSQLEAVDHASKQQILHELARLDKIREVQTRMKTQVLPALQENLGNPAVQDEYDIASVFTLMLMDETKAVRQIVIDRIKGVRDLVPNDGGAKTVEQPPVDQTDLW